MNKRKGVITIITVFIFVGLATLITALLFYALKIYQVETIEEMNTKLYYIAESGATWGLENIKKNGTKNKKEVFYIDKYKVEVSIENIEKEKNTVQGELISKGIDEEKKKMKEIKILFRYDEKEKTLVVEDCES